MIYISSFRDRRAATGVEYLKIKYMKKIKIYIC